MKKVWLGLIIGAALGGGLLFFNSISKADCDGNDCDDAVDVVALDEEQANVNREAFAQRFQHGCSISNLARNVVAYRIQQRNLNVNATKAQRLAIQGRKGT